MQYSEKDIENMMIEDVTIIDEDLEVIGNQISLGGYGTLDILAFDTAKQEYVIIELKSEVINDKAITQLMRYIVALEDYLEEIEDNTYIYPVRGIVAAPKIDEEAKSTLRYVQDKIEYYEININLTSESHNYIRVKDKSDFKSGLAAFKAIVEEFSPEQYEIPEEPPKEELEQPQEGD